MSNEITKDTFRAVLVQDPRICADTLDDTYTTALESGLEIAGITSDSDVTISARGTLNTVGQDVTGLTLEVQNGGTPRDSDETTRVTITADGVEYGQDHTGIPDLFRWHVQSNAGKEYYTPHATTKQDLEPIVAYVSQTGGVYSVHVDTRDNGVWQSQTISLATGDFDRYANPFILRLQDNTLILYAFVVDAMDLSTSGYFLRSWVSDETGDSWSVGNTSCLSEGLTTAFAILGMDFADTGSAILGFYEQEDTIYQIVSSNHGLTYSAIGDIDGKYPHVENYNGELQFFYRTTATSSIYRIPMTSPYTLLDDTVRVEVATGGQYFFAAWQAEGLVFLYDRKGSSYDYDIAVYHTSDFSSYRTYGLSDYTLRYEDNTGTLNAVSVTYSQGQHLLFADVYNTSAYDDTGIVRLTMGSITSLTIPTMPATPYNAQISPILTYLAFDLPTSWSDPWNSAGTASAVITEDGLTINSGPANYRRYTTDSGKLTLPNSFDTEVIVTAELDVQNGGSTAGDSAGIRLYYRDTSNNQYALTLRFSTSGVAIYDINAGSTLDTYLYDATDRRKIIIAILDGDVKVWLSQSLAADPSYHTYTEIFSEALTLSTGAASTELELQFGILSTAGSVTEMNAGHVAIYQNIEDGTELMDGASLVSAHYPLSASPQGLPNGAVITASGGPAGAGDSFSYATRSNYAVENVLPDERMSPRDLWLSSDGTQQSIAFDLTGLAENTAMLSTLGLALLNSNATSVSIKSRTTTGTATTLYSGSPRMGSLVYSRAGNLLEPGVGAAETRFVHENELIGEKVTFSSTTDIRTIVANTAGFWSDSADVQGCRILLDRDEMDAGEPTSAGFISISQKNSAYLLPQIPEDFRYLEIELDTDQDQLQVGSLVLGNVVYFPRDYSRDFTRTTLRNIESVVLEDGTLLRKEMGPERRTASFGWKEGINARPLGHTPGYVAVGATSKVTVGTPAATDGVVEGLISLVSESACVYLPVVTGNSDSAQVVTGRNSLIYGVLQSDYSEENILGSENETQLVRVGLVQIDEVV